MSPLAMTFLPKVTMSHYDRPLSQGPGLDLAPTSIWFLARGLSPGMR